MFHCFVDTDKTLESQIALDKPTENPTEKLSLNQTEILKQMAINASISSRELAHILAIRVDSVRENIANLKKGLLKRIGPAKGGHWQLIKK